jgi:uncharacterized protein YkwD
MAILRTASRPPLFRLFLLVTTLLIVLTGHPASAVDAPVAPRVSGTGDTHTATGRSKTRQLRTRMVDLLNGMRTRHQLPAFRVNASLSDDALSHTRRMVDSNSLFHTTDLARLCTSYGASVWGEAIGYAGTLRRVVQLWMASPTHHALLVDRRFRHVGIGVVHARGWFWLTLDLYG